MEAKEKLLVILSLNAATYYEIEMKSRTWLHLPILNPLRGTVTAKTHIATKLQHLIHKRMSKREERESGVIDRSLPVKCYLGVSIFNTRAF